MVHCIFVQQKKNQCPILKQKEYEVEMKYLDKAVKYNPKIQLERL
jgi:hypothetical protein